MISEGPDRPERYHPRVEANILVKVLLEGRTVAAKARDLSMAGLFLLAHPGPAQQQLTIALPLPGERELKIRCDIRRRDVDGVALEFGQLDWDDLFALARFLHPRLP